MKSMRISVLVLVVALAAAPALAKDAAPSKAKPAPAAVQPAAKAPAAAPAPAAAKPTPAATEKAPAPAQTAEKQTWWQGALLILVKAVVPILASILSILLMVLVNKWKLNIERERVEWIVGKATGFGEQKLRNLLREGKDPDYDGIKKSAIDFGDKLLIQEGLAAKWGKLLTDLIEAKLGQSKLEGDEKPKSAVKHLEISKVVPGDPDNAA